MSELELSLLRARSMEALKQKARRGELFFTVAVGYVKVGRDKIEQDPDLRVREAIGMVFARFAEMQSIRQVFLSLRADRIALPYIDPRGTGQRQLLWKLPVYATVNNLLTNPVYAGAYAFGRTGSRTTIDNGRKRILRGYRKNRSDWAVLLVDHHDGYLSWADYERNQRLIADNANGKGMMARGAVRKGEALLAGLMRCGHCGRRLLVSYNGTKGDIGRYNCDATRSNPGAPPCISFGALRVDEAVGAEIVRLLQPLGVEAAVRAIADSEHQTAEKQRQIELALEQARYEAARARRQYDAVDPDNRLVAGELERLWCKVLEEGEARQFSIQIRRSAFMGLRGIPPRGCVCSNLSWSSKICTRATKKAASGEASIITQLSASQPTDSRSPRRRRFPPRTAPLLARHAACTSRWLSTHRICHCVHNATCRIQLPRCVSASHGLWRTHCHGVLVADRCVSGRSSRMSDAVGLVLQLLFFDCEAA